MRNLTLALVLLVPALASAQSTAPAARRKKAPAQSTAATPAPSTAATPAPAAPRLTAEPAAAPKEKGSFILAPKIGLFEPTTRLSGAFYAGLEAGYVTPALDHRLAIVAELDWYRPKVGGNATDPQLTVNGQTNDGAYRLGESQVGVLLSAIYRAEDALPGFTPYAGLGPGLYSHRAAINAFGSTNLETETRLGFQIVGGGDLQLGPGALFAEARYHFARVDFVSTGHVNAGGFLALGLGYRLRL